MLAFLVLLSASRPAPCDGATAGLQDCGIEHDGRKRQYRLYVPDADSSEPRMLVLDFHGRGGGARSQQRWSGWYERARSEGLVVAWPQGVGLSWSAGGCCGTAHEREVDDVGFVARLIADVQRLTPIDGDRIYATGVSNGGRMVHRLGCELHEVAAIAPIIGPLSRVDTETGQTALSCEPGRAVPTWTLHGTADTCTPYGGGGGRDTHHNPAFVDVVAFWSENNQCGAEPVSATTAATTCVAHAGCNDDASVVACTVDGGGHIVRGLEPYPGWERPLQGAPEGCRRAIGALSPRFPPTFPCPGSTPDPPPPSAPGTARSPAAPPSPPADRA